MPEITDSQRRRVSALLGREARGLRAIPVTGPGGEPRVIQVASLVDERPFPTLFWLVDPELNYLIDRLEAAGLIAQFQQQVDNSETLRAGMEADHSAHIDLRNRLMTEQDRGRLRRLGFYEALQRRGIGGIEKPTRIRCLHTWYAAHLVEPNTIGRMMDAHWASEEN